jgi:hypothetical protein
MEKTKTKGQMAKYLKKNWMGRKEGRRWRRKHKNGEGRNLLEDGQIPGFFKPIQSLGDQLWSSQMFEWALILLRRIPPIHLVVLLFYSYFPPHSVNMPPVEEGNLLHSSFFKTQSQLCQKSCTKKIFHGRKWNGAKRVVWPSEGADLVQK